MDDPTPLDALRPTLDRLRDAWEARRPDARQRRNDLDRLAEALREGRDAMVDAIDADFGHRSRHETLLAEGMGAVSEVRRLRRSLGRWMRPARGGAGWRLWPARAQLRREPLGVVGVMSPWNYPVILALAPLATAIAAGNHVYLKPSEQTPRTSAWLRDLLATVFPEDRVAVALGGPELASAFSALPFDHLVFTGSTAIGRRVMAAAAENLTPLTLELGGKSPAIVAADYPPAKAAARLATGKWFNAGQTCIAPDYVLVARGSRDALVDALRAEVRARYPDLAASSDYTWIISGGQHRRLRGLVEDSRARGLEVIELAEVHPAVALRHRILPPTLVLDPGDDALLMREEIFGPVLPVIAYDRLEDAIAFVRRRDRPLALYPFSHDRATVEAILGQVVAGGVTVNDTLLHFAAHGLPFGGVGASGMGAYHGRAGFDAMTRAMPVLWQRRVAASDLLRPPYRGLADRLVRLLAR